MRLIALLVCAVAGLEGPGLFAIQPEEGLRILRRVDELRNPLTNFSIDLELTNYRQDQAEVWKFRVFGRGKDKSLVEFLSPATEQGKYLLMLRDAMWVYVPSTSRPIRISPLQRLMGEASNGDVARSVYSADYVPELVTEEELEGRPAYVLELKAKDSDLSYTRVKLWVSRNSGEPIKADYFVSSGKLMKHLLFREFGVLGGVRVVTKVEILDAVRPDRRTIMTYSNLVSKQVSEKMFQPSYLGKW